MRAGLIVLSLAVTWLAMGCEPPPDNTAITNPGPADAASQPTDANKPKRIVSVALGSDEMLLELVGPKRLAGVSHFVDQPYSNVTGRVPANIPRVRGEIEQVLKLEPDLVCTFKFNTDAFIRQVREAGVPVWHYEKCDSIKEIQAAILELGRLVGEPDRARQMVARMDARLKTVADKLAGVRHRPRVFYWTGGWTAGSGTTMHDVITAAGGRNAALDLRKKGHQRIDPAEVLSLDPDIVLVAEGPAEIAHGNIQDQQALARLRAVREGRIIRMPLAKIQAISQHIVEAVEFLAPRLHPERFRP